MNKVLHVANKATQRLFFTALIIFAVACATDKTQKHSAQVEKTTVTNAVVAESPVEASKPLIIIENEPQYIDLGEFEITAYCPCVECSEGWGNMTSTGVLAQENRTIAVDPKVIPYGSVLKINGVEYTAEDCGGDIKGKRLDVYFENHADTYSWGVQKSNVLLKVRENDG